MADPQTSRFWQAALQSGLVDVAALEACWEALPAEKRGADQLDRRLARQAIQAGKITLWQAQQLLSGRSSGFKIDRYILLDMIGQGGMGRVYLARDSRLNRNVALKILSPERVNNPRAIARFQREARVGAQLQHENLVRIYDEGESAGKCYLVMEFIEGKTIGSMIAKQGPMPPSVAARLTRQVALGLEHAQQKGLIHRDVNPYNILVTRDGTAKLTDLGLAIDLGEQAAVTRDGATVGTFDYISPEQARHSHSVDTRSDIYSLGCTLYHMLAGQVPFPGPSLPEKLYGHQALEPTPLSELVSAVPEGLAEVVRKMMRKAPTDRYPSPLEVAQALEPYADGQAAASYRDDASAAPGSGSGSGLSRAQATQSGTKVTGPRRDVLPVTEQIPAPDVPPTQELANLDPGPDAAARSGLAAEAGQPAAAIPSMDFAPIAEEPPPKLDLSGLGLALDLGPEPSLSETAARARPRPPAPEPKPKPEPARSPDARGEEPARGSARGLDRYLVLGGAAALVLVVVAGGLFASGVLGKPGRARPADGPPGRVAAVPKAPAAGTAAPNRAEVPRGQAIAVKAPDGTLTMEPDLKSAMQRAIGSRGHVLLNNREPIRLSGANAAIKVAGGPLYIRAAAGARPVLEVEIKGPRPFLSVGLDTPLTLAGVTIVARFAEQPNEAPPLIEALSGVTLERCAFKAAGAGRGSTAVSVQGAGLTAAGCWFEGFERTLDVGAFSGSSVVLRQCMMVRAGDDADATEGAGWAVRVRSMPGGVARLGRRLLVDHCTVRGQGLLDLVEFSPQMPYKVDVRGCAVMAGALLAWEPKVAGTPPSAESLEWTGQGNLYDISGKSWVVLSPQGAPGLARGPGDLESWSKLVKESAPLAAPITFRTDPSALSKSPAPQDFAVLKADAPVGADPDRVGPSAEPSKKS